MRSVLEMSIESRPASAAAPVDHARSERGVLIALCFALLGSACVLDPYAEAAFDAPKRLIAMASAVVGAGVWVWQARGSMPAWRLWRRPAQLAVAALVLMALGLVVTTVLADHGESAWSGLRTLAVYALFLPLGASFSRASRHATWVYRAAAVAVMLNAVISLLQAVGLSLPIPMTSIGGRFATGALLGNEGYVALASVLMASASFAWGLNTHVRRERVLALVLFGTGAVTIAVNHQLTSAIALGLALVVILCVRWRKPGLVVIGAAVMLCAAGAALVPAVRDATWSALPVGGVEGYQKLTTNRLGAWAAALEMIEARPWIGFGPASYAQLSQRMRLQAELRWRTRLLPPPTGTTFVVAHQEYLQLAAEAGVPVLLSLMLAAGALIGGLLRAARSPGPTEPLALLGVLVAGAVSALAWFPLQIPLTAVMLLLAAGRAWRLLAEPTEARS